MCNRDSATEIIGQGNENDVWLCDEVVLKIRVFLILNMRFPNKVMDAAI
jgi:hypothetical protein